MQSLDTYRNAIETYLESYADTKDPKNLYEPIRYILELGGKRLRPVLTLMSAEIFGCPVEKAIHAAVSVEVFHNFSLVHDDIMDDAPLRRGKKTVHEQWDINTGILSGDAMLIMAYRLFEAYDPPLFNVLAKLFSKTAMEVCEGQQYDIDFETRDDVTVAEYLKMIEYKTAVLVGAALKMGAIVAGASTSNQDHIYDFGRNLGIAFQLQDDYLDAFGNVETFGKQVGGDIIENKKTYLYLKALEFSRPDERDRLRVIFNDATVAVDEKIEAVKAIYVSSGSAAATQEAISGFTKNAFDVLKSMDISTDNKKMLIQFGDHLMNRTF